jgi:SAM-dependent methyltransferase
LIKPLGPGIEQLDDKKLESGGDVLERSFLVRIFGFRAALFHGDCLVWDRWRWLERRLPPTRDDLTLIDVGCGNGVFTIGGAIRGYHSVGLSWDKPNQALANERAKICRAIHVNFPVLDVRQLGNENQFTGKFDVALCFETVEHILDDRKLFKDIFNCLKPGGFLLLSTPFYFYRAISSEDDGPFPEAETGGHVRRGYTPSMLMELCGESGFTVEEISSCSGFFSQKITALLRLFDRVHLYPIGWLLILPLRILPPLLDPLVRRLTGWPDYSICLLAYKPRWSNPRAEREEIPKPALREEIRSGRMP